MIVRTNRIESLDVLRGIVMVIMAIDHIRDFFYYGAFFGNPTDLETTTPILFFTRFITHYCAPVFVFLAGTSAFLYGSTKKKPQLFRFLLSRGIWLILLEIILVNRLWTFDLSFSAIIFQVIWAIGFSMICLSVLIFLPKKILFAVGVLLIAGHNFLDGIQTEGKSFNDFLWYLLHQHNMLVVDSGTLYFFHYPVLPWIGVIVLGYLFGSLYKKDFAPELRRKWLNRMGFGALAFFLILRGFNLFGDMAHWGVQDTITKSVLSFFNVTKYPPSLLYLLITLGPAMITLSVLESVKNRITDFFLVFGRVPLFYYVLHLLFIHLLAILVLIITGGDWRDMIITADVFINQTLASSYGYSLIVVYLVWVMVVFSLYPICRKYMEYKANNRDKWWLSYL